MRKPKRSVDIGPLFKQQLLIFFVAVAVTMNHRLLFSTTSSSLRSSAFVFAFSTPINSNSVRQSACRSSSFIRSKTSCLLRSYHNQQQKHLLLPRHLSRLNLDYTSTQYTQPKSTSTNSNTTSNNDDDDEEESNDEFFTMAEQDADCINYPKGTPEGFYIIKQYPVSNDGFTTLVTKQPPTSSDGIADSALGHGVTQEEIERLKIVDGKNVTLPIALMLLDQDEYPSLSRARKACRKGYIVVHRGPLGLNEETGEYDVFDQEKCIRGRVADRVYPTDVIGRQVRMHGGFYPGFDNAKPPFDLPVVYEDDHFAIVNKPAGVVVYSQRKQGHGMMTIRAALPFVLKPPKRGTLAIIRRPSGVHRLDKPTSGLLLVAKTKPAMVDLTRQFAERVIQKTYTAILNGVPSEPIESRITVDEARKLGVDVDTSDGAVDASVSVGENANQWQLIDSPMDDGKSAVTVWRPLKYVDSLKANEETLTLVEMKPKTGRYHQLRRHMAWVRDCPIVGDKAYDGGGDAMSLRGRGLFLCSNKLALDHPYYNTEVGRKDFDALPEEEKWADGMIQLSEDGSKVKVHASIDLPAKFASLLSNEGSRAEKFAEGDTNEL